ncbi:MAG: c-type cytochrome [Bacteroidia bacterium]
MNKTNIFSSIGFIRKALLITSFIAFQSFFIACESEQADDADDTDNTEQTETGTNADANVDPNDGKGVGPIKSVDVGAGINASMAEKGKVLFEAKCTACHNNDSTKKVGPGLAAVTERRKPEWIMNMILNPEKMVQEDPIAKELLGVYLAPMANQSLTEEEARQILEYFRQSDQKK